MIRKLFLTAGVFSLGVVAPQSLAAPGEIFLHIDATGTVAPDAMVVPVPLEGSGTSREEALRVLEQAKAATLAELSSKGIDAANAKMSEPVVTEMPPLCSNVDDCAIADTTAAAATVVMATVDAAAAEGAEPAQVKRKKKQSRKEREAELALLTRSAWSASAILEVDIPFDEVGRLRERGLAGSEWLFTGMMGQAVRFRDPEAARRTARENAIANARAEAEAYADALGYRVVRIAGVSNAPAPFAAVDLISFFSKFDGPRRDPGFLFSERAHVGIDFVIAPK